MDQILLTVNAWMMTETALAALGCFLWGMISVVLSPCHMASIPLIVTYVAGQDRALKTSHAVHYAVSFTVGLFLTIAMVGIVCSLLGRMLGKSALIGPCWWERSSSGWLSICWESRSVPCCPAVCSAG